MPTPFDCTASWQRSPKRSIARSSRQTRWRSGCRPTALPAPSITSMRRSRGLRMSFRNFTTARAILSAENIWSSCPVSACATRTNSRCQFAGRNAGDGGAQASLCRHRGEHRAGRYSRRHSGGSVLSRWQESLRNLARLPSPKSINSEKRRTKDWFAHRCATQS